LLFQKLKRGRETVVLKSVHKTGTVSTRDKTGRMITGTPKGHSKVSLIHTIRGGVRMGVCKLSVPPLREV
jgi:hypothetical protein